MKTIKRRSLFLLILCIVLGGCHAKAPSSSQEGREKEAVETSSEGQHEAENHQTPAESSQEDEQKKLLLINPRLYPEDTLPAEDELYRKLQASLDQFTELKEELSLSPPQDVIFEVDHLGLIIMVLNPTSQECKQLSLDLKIDKDQKELIKKQYDLDFSSFGSLKQGEAVMVVLPLPFEYSEVFKQFSLDKFSVEMKIKKQE